MRVVALLLILAALAGCAGKDEPKVEAEPTAQTGCIEGVVVDGAIRPLEGAEVSIPRANATIVTAADGAFSLCDLEPGLYIIQVSLVDYLDVETNAEVRAGEAAHPQVILPVDPAPKPFHRLWHFSGFINASVGIANSLGEPVMDQFGIGTCHCSFPVTAEGPVNTFIVEADWDDSVPPGPAGPTQYYAELSAAESGNVVSNYVQDPGYWYVEGSSFDFDDRTFTASLYSDDLWPAVQQDYELYVTLFYYSRPPEGWSFIEGWT